MISKNLTTPCIHCKGNHAEADCPLYKRALSFMKISESLSSDNFSGSSPAPFIGRFGYPFVNVGILAPPEIGEQVAGYDAPRQWAETNAKIPEIVGFRSSLINSRTSSDIRSSSKIIDLAREISLAKKPVDVDIELVSRPDLNVVLDGTMAPTGPVAKLRAISLASTPSINTRIERAFSATDLKASDAVFDLYSHGFDENQLGKMLSTASLGVGASRKLVPTRWAITATDDIIGKGLLSEIKDFSLKHDFSAYFDGYLGNYYLVLTFPKVWSFELFESFAPSKMPDGSYSFSTDFETYAGRKEYAHATAGGYYTARLAVLEKLKELKRQSSVLVLRFITQEYTVPLGVWVTRQACRKSMSSKPIFFHSQDELLSYAKSLVRSKFNLDLNFLLSKSRLLKSFNQLSLDRF